MQLKSLLYGFPHFGDFFFKIKKPQLFGLWLCVIVVILKILKGGFYSKLFSFKILYVNKIIPATKSTVNLIEKDFSTESLSSHFINFSLKYKRYATKITIKQIKKT